MFKRLIWDKPNGISLVEFALVLPLLLLFIFGVLDLGFGVYASNTIALAAREGARVGIICTNSDSQIRTQVQNTALLLNLTNAQIQISTGAGTACTGGYRPHAQPVTVTVTYTYIPLTPVIGNVIGNGGISMTSRASMMVE